MSIDETCDKTDGAEVKGQAYATIPEWILEKASGQAVRLFGILDRYVGRNESAWPSRKTLADRLNCSIQTIDRSLAELVKIDAIAIKRRKRSDGSYTSSTYMLWPLTRSDLVPTVGPPGTVVGTTRGSNPSEVSPPQQLLRVEKTTSALEALAEVIWSAYPRKIGKKDAMRVLMARLKQGVPIDELTNATVNYAATRDGSDQQYTLHPKTFFGPGERWKDFLPGGEGLVSAPRSKQQIESMIIDAGTIISTMYGMSSEQIQDLRPHPNKLVERILEQMTVRQLGRMTEREFNNTIRAFVYPQI